MPKNMTRKGLAVGVAAAFVASGISSLPAAAEEVLGLTPSAGSGYTTLSDSTFTLVTTLPTNTTAAAAATLSYRIENPSLEDMDIDMQGGADAGNIVAYPYGSTSAVATGGDADTSHDNIADDDFVVHPASKTVAAAAGNANGALGQTNSLTIINNTANEEFSVEVTAFLDVDGDNVIDAGESVSPTRTVTFEQAEDVTASVAMVTPLVGDETLTARVTFANSDINVRQIDNGDVLVQFGTTSSATTIKSYGDDETTGGAPAETTTTVVATDLTESNVFGNDVRWNSTLGVYEAVFNPFDTSGTSGLQNFTAAAATVYTAKLFIDNGGNGTTTVGDTQEGTTATATTAAAATAYTVTWSVVGSADAINTKVGGEDSGGSWDSTGITDNQHMTALVRTTALEEASDTTFRVFVGTDATTTAAVEDVPVQVTFTTSGVTVGDDVKVDGLSLHSSQSRVISKDSDASGYVTFAITGGAADNGDQIKVVLNVNGTAPGADVNSVDGTINFQTADYDIHAQDDLGAEGGISIASGDTVTVDYEVVDQFGTFPADGLYRVVARDKASSNSERSTAADFAVAAPITGGVASVTFTDNGVGAGSYTLQAGWTTLDDTINTGNSDDVDLTVNVMADAAAASITLEDLAYGSEQLEDANSDGDYSDAGDTDNRTELVLETESIFTYITNLAGAGDTAPDLTSGLEVTIAGTVKNAAGTAIPYAPVTIAADKFLFVANSNYVMDSITLFADNTGDFSVNVYSQSSGINNLSVTAGAASETVTLTYAGATSGAADDFTVTLPATSEPGKTVDVAVMVTDANGNAVEGASMTLSSTGPGYLINTTGTSLSDGTFNTKLLLGANDSGTATVKVAITIDGDEVIKTATVLVGTDVVADADKKVNAGSFKGYVAVYAKGYAGQRMSAKIGNDWVIVPSLASNFERVVDFTGAGVDIAVRIYIDRVLLDTINLTTK